MASRFVLIGISLLVVNLAWATAAEANNNVRKRRTREEFLQWRKTHCTNCTVNGKEYQGHSRFRYEEGCNRYRCTCRCNGSWECPASRTINICENGQRRGRAESAGGSGRRASTRSTTERSSRRNQRRNRRCQTCKVNGREHRSNAYFRHVDGCTTYDRCVCHCNGSWECPASSGRNTCQDGGGSSGTESAARGTTSDRGESNRRKTGTASGRRPNSGRRRNGNGRRRSRCKTCSAFGKEFKGRSYFSGQKDCTNYTRCVCYCSGSWKCPERFAKNICEEGDSSSGAQTQTTCNSCTVKGQTFDGKSSFDLTDGCIAYKNCRCNCDGSWSCSNTTATNICTGSGAESKTNRGSAQVSGKADCKECYVRGKTIRGSEQFNITVDCAEYTNCECFCNGSWHCPEGRDICKPEAPDRGERRTQRGCRECIVKGNKFAPNKYFDWKDDCIEYSNCACHCNGSWDCPGSSARNVCEAERRDRENDCRDCEVYGETYKTKQNFTITRGCQQYKDCRCHCNGSWDCPGSSSRNICDANGRPRVSEKKENGEDNTLSTSRVTRGECRSCRAFDKTFKDQYFNVTEGCINYRNCICRCDGSWKCRAENAVNICETRQTPKPTEPSAKECSSCRAHNMVVEGNTEFTLKHGCWDYKNCMCFCNGTWDCPSHSAVNTCTKPGPRKDCLNCNAKGKVITGGTEFNLTDGCDHYQSCTCDCDGSWQCLPENRKDICFGAKKGEAGSECSMCKAKDGNLYTPNQPFTFVDDCIERNCDCFCNGSWSCPGERSQWICTDRCRGCEVEGRKVRENSVFKHKTGCLEYTCNCHCNGSWSCPGDTVRNTCPVGVRDNCNTCRVSATEEHPGESDFVLKQGCLHYKCRCNCDGSYSCPAEDSRNVCYGEKLGGCRSCVLSENEFYKGESDFSMRQDCIAYECRCNCNGTWQCPREKARNVCIERERDRCKVCRVDGGQTYQGNTTFELRRDCLHYKCKCNCDGSWKCPGEHTRNVCRGEVPGGCRSCVISDTEFYPGNSNFEMVKDCIHFKCMCNCDGSYNCPGERARRVCSTPNEKEEVQRPRETQCQRCRISQREQFEGNTEFSLTRGCQKYRCACKCDGSWECPPEKTENTCRRNGQRQPNTQEKECKVCRRDGKEFSGNSNFTLTRGCNRYDCTCRCDGTSTCDTRNPTYICSGQGRGRPDTRRRVESTRRNFRGRQRCTPCDVAGTRVNQNQRFYLENGCLLYKGCTCRCSGDWQCSQKEKICENRSQSNGGRVIVRFEGDSSSSSSSFSSSSSSRSSTSGGSRSRDNGQRGGNTTEIESSAWVYVDGVNSSFVKVGEDEKTGGGYKIEVQTKYAPTNTYRDNKRRLGQLRVDNSSMAFTASGSTPDKSSHLQHHVEASGSASSSEAESAGAGSGLSRCKQCLADSKSYPSGAHFDMRRGCVVYKCLCLCSGSYRCRLTSDNACTAEKQQSSCRNCLYQGMIFPGRMGFTVREGCLERECNCHCNGTHSCPSSKPLPGCSASSPAAGGLPTLGSFYPMTHGLIPNSVGYVRRTGNRVYTRCPSCGAGTPIVYHTPVRVVPSTERRVVPSESADGEREGSACSGCDVEGTYRKGGTTFSFEKDCVEFDCYCACGGSWKCAGRPLNCTSRPKASSGSETSFDSSQQFERLVRRRGEERAHDGH